MSFSTDLRGFGDATLIEATLIWDEDLFAVNSMDDPDRVLPKAHTAPRRVDGSSLRAELPPASWSMFVLQVS